MRRIFAPIGTWVCFLSGISLGITSANAFDSGYTISTIAGSSWNGDNGPATLAILTQAEGIVCDSAGNFYVADAANHRIRRITRAGAITTFAGTGVAGFSGDGGPASSAQLNSPYGLVMDGVGNLFVADLGNARVRIIGVDGNIATIAGGGSLAPGGSSEGSAATMIALAAPRNVALDGRGALYVSDFGGHRVYRVDLNGPSTGGNNALTTVAGNGAPGVAGDNGAATRAQLAYPAGIALDRNGALYIADSQNHLIRKVAGGVISSYARAVTPTGMVIDGFGTLYVADPGAGQILAFPANAPPAAYASGALDLTFGADGYLYASQVTTVVRVSFAGVSPIVAGGGSLASGDGGAATNALLNHPSGVAGDALGNIYIADRDNHRIRKVALDGTITTIAGTGIAGNLGDGGLATQAQLNGPSSITLDANGNLYIADTGNHRIRKISPAGVIVAAPFTGLPSPVYALADSTGNVYVADTGLGAILKRTPAGTITQLAANLGSPGGFALDSSGNFYFAEVKAKRVSKLDILGNLTTIADGVWNAPTGIALGSSGDLFVSDSGLERLLRVDSTGSVTIVAGTGAAGLAGDGSDAANAQLNSPSGLAIDPFGAIYVADLDNNRVRKLTPQSSGIIAPLTLINAVNAASLQPGPVAPGMLLDVTGTGLTAADAANIQILFQADSQTPIAAQILSIDANRIELRVPTPIAGANSVAIQVLNKTVLVAQIAAPVADAVPGVFADASGQALALNEDGTLNSAANPAARGSILVLFGTGEGVSGLPVSVNIGGYTADVLYAGPVAGYPGLLQVNARMPSGYIGPGIYGIAIGVGTTLSQPGVAMSLK
jgi:uncharacterized protein (TIGR03437 family)